MHPELQAACDRLEAELKLPNPRPIWDILCTPGKHPDFDTSCSDNVIPQWFQGLTKWMDEYRPAAGKDIWRTAYWHSLGKSAWMGEEGWGELELRVRDIADQYRQSHRLVRPTIKCFDEFVEMTPAKIAEMPQESYRWYYTRNATRLLCHWAMGGGDEQSDLPGPVSELISKVMAAWDAASEPRSEV